MHHKAVLAQEGFKSQAHLVLRSDYAFRRRYVYACPESEIALLCHFDQCNAGLSGPFHTQNLLTQKA